MSPGPGGASEPMVGSIRALRTFRIGDDGGLYPLYGDERWGPCDNRASCRSEPGAHDAPGVDCDCGFYAYSGTDSIAEYPQAQVLLASVLLSGHVIVGEYGVRAEHARIEAVRLSGAVPPALAAAVARGYPDAVVTTDRSAFDGRFRPDPLVDYQETRQVRRSLLHTVAAVLALAVALSSATVLFAPGPPAVACALGAGAVTAAAAVLLARWAVHRRRIRPLAMTSVAVLLWIVAALLPAAADVTLRVGVVVVMICALALRWTVRGRADQYGRE